MRVLLTNDDGFDAAGMRAIRGALASSGAFESVVTVAPDENCSGFARKCTFSRPVGVRRVEGGPHPIYRCDGTPTDCVRVGLLGGLAPDADLVISGINHGANLADDVNYSGTIGAGLEAAILGVSAICLSQQTPSGSLSVNYSEGFAVRYDFGFAARHGAGLAAAVTAAKPAEPVVLSVNYPSNTEALDTENGPAVLTRPGQRDYPRSAVAEEWDDDTEVRYLYLFGEPDEDIRESGDVWGTDIAALSGGRISITPLSFALGARDLSPAHRQFFARLGAAIDLTDSPGFSASTGGRTG